MLFTRPSPITKKARPASKKQKQDEKINSTDGGDVKRRKKNADRKRQTERVSPKKRPKKHAATEGVASR